jgi:hypothetical protein
VGVAEFVDGVDRLLTRAHGLFPAAAADGGAVVGASSGGAGAPPVPGGASGLGEGAGVAGGVYRQAQSTLTGLDAQTTEAAQEAVAVAGQGRLGSGAVRDQARAQAAAMMPMSHTAAGARLLVSTMDERLAAMQRQLGTTTTQNHGVATRLQSLAAGYRRLSDLAQSGGAAKDAPPGDGAEPLKWKPGDKRHRPYITGPDGLGPPNPPDAPPYVHIPGTNAFVRSDELPGLVIQDPSLPGPATRYDGHGNPDPYISLGPNTGAWVPKSEFPGAKFYPPDCTTELPPYGYEEWLPHSGIFMWHGDLVNDPYPPRGPSQQPAPTYPQGR